MILIVCSRLSDDSEISLWYTGLSHNITNIVSSNLTANCVSFPEIIHKIMKEKDSITLPCPHSGEGKATWSRERNGHKVDTLIVDGDRDIRLINKPYKRYSSLADKSLHIHRAAKYFCNNEPAAELTVIPSGNCYFLWQLNNNIFQPRFRVITMVLPPYYHIVPKFYPLISSFRAGM